MNNGHLTHQMGDIYMGAVSTFSFAAPIKLEPRGPNPQTGVIPEIDGREPTHDVLVKTPDGRIVPGGAAWSKRIKRGEHEGSIMFSISLSLPDILDRDLSLAAFPRSDGWEIVAERRRGGGATPPPAGDQPAPLDGAIPF